MKKMLILPLLCIALTSCGIDKFTRTLYLSARFKLKYAAYIEGYNVDMSPYFFQLPNRTDYLPSFDKEKTYINFETAINDNGRPYGFGNCEIVFSDSLIPSFCFGFDYYGAYDGTYGGDIIITPNAYSEKIGRATCFSRYWWVRLEAFLPEICDKKLILEFQFYEMNEEPSEFDHKIW